MTSDRRREANRRNAAKSTGPKTEEGRRRVSQNARRHRLTLPPDREIAAEHLAALLGDPFIETRPLAEERHALAQGLADAEARLDRVRDAEMRFLQDTFSEDRRSAHLVERWERISETWRVVEGVSPEASRRILERHGQKPYEIKRKEKKKTSSEGNELRRLLRYRKEAENRRHRALREWIAHLHHLRDSKTKPMAPPP